MNIIKKDFEGTYLGIMTTCIYDLTTKKVSNTYANLICKIHKIDDKQYLVEINNLNTKITTELMFFESSNGLESFSNQILNKFFYSSNDNNNNNNKLSYAWSKCMEMSSTTNSNSNVISNGYATLDKACIKCG